MRYRWITIPTLSLGMLALAVNDGLAQRGSGGPPGGGGMRGPASTPEEAWARLGAGPNDTSFDLNKNPSVAMRLKYMNMAIPTDGIIRRDQYLAQYAQYAAARQQGGGPPGLGGPPPAAAVTGGGDKPAVILVPGEEAQPQPGGQQRGPGGPPGGDRGGPPGGDRGGDRGRGGPPGGDRGGQSGGGGWGGGGGSETRKVEDPDDERPNVLRYGKTPKELPGWFTELDTDKDAQIGLYEWRAAGKSIEDFLAKDLNGDGFLTVDEVLKSPGSGGTSEAKGDSRGNPFSKGGSSGASADPRSNKGDKNNKDNKADKNESKTTKEEKKSESSSGGNPFLKK